ncbi:hypothetical protein GA0061101_10557 [Rhizobium lusitanum]|uniref:Uncharacterized protein n=1 Tax=Rhizobium lusitanum TaxID=293958 RepID=A0A1C3VDD8_9HYPH|nr:hypothetical protein [Ensifer adhaerens]SCB25793.1 hypothetical protein GA0061101_10557 [Rhizobium lusitanum]
MDRANGSLTGILSSVAAFCWICGQKAIAAMQRSGAVSSGEPFGLSCKADQRARSVIAVMDCSNVRVVPPKIICQSQECV